jgi:membrane-associated protease RseP (regulator of RpoE activity)
MGLMFWYLLALGIIILWTVAVSAIWGKWKEQLEKKSIQCMGPFVMWKTQKGKELIERIATTRAKWVELYGRISVAITGASMVTMTLLLLLSAILVMTRAKDIEIEPHMLLGLPGLNPMIPLWYGILGLVVAMVVHEFSHGLLTILAKVKVVSLGIMFFIFPMGAFVEPDEEAIKKIEKKKRVRMYSAGPASNIIVAGVFSVIFSIILMSSVQPVSDGVGIMSSPEPIEIPAMNFTMDTPAMNASLVKGMIITNFNHSEIIDREDFNIALNNTIPGQNVTIVYTYNGNSLTIENVTLAPKAYYLQQIYGEDYVSKYVNSLGWAQTPENEAKALEWYINKGYLGVSTMTVTDSFFHPIAESESLGDFAKYASIYITLPLQRLSPVDGVTMSFYEVTGFWSFLPVSAFWVLANACYWIFWLNLMVGLSNALPAVPLDGGYIFKDWLDSLLGRMKAFSNPEKRVKVVDTVAVIVAFTILFLILWQVIGPRIF